MILLMSPRKKDEFLSNDHNKSKLIEMMKKYFLNDGQTVYVSNADADTDIAKTALQVIIFSVFEKIRDMKTFIYERVSE